MYKFSLYLFLIYVTLLISSCEKDESEIAVEVEKQLIEQLNTCKREKYDISFLHISDTHGSNYTLAYMVSMLNKTDALFGIITGDLVLTSSMEHTISSSTKPIFVLPGNHDAYDNMSQYWFRKQILNTSRWKSLMIFGDVDANYYYVDIYTNNKQIRLICLDQYELEAVGIECAYNIIMSQKQIDWFIKSLESAEQYDAIIVAMHCGFGNSTKGGRDFSNQNKFVSIKTNPESYEFSGPADPCMIPDIINSYLSGDNISKNYSSGDSRVDLKVETNFKTEHSNFVFYIGGHIHMDVAEYLNYYPNQLQSIISSAYYVCPSSYDDLARESTGINAITMNDCLIDISNREIQLIRLGARNILNGSVRDEITFSY